MFGVSKKIKVTTLYVTKVIYSVVIFMAIMSDMNLTNRDLIYTFGGGKQ